MLLGVSVPLPGHWVATTGSCQPAGPGPGSRIALNPLPTAPVHLAVSCSAARSPSPALSAASRSGVLPVGQGFHGVSMDLGWHRQLSHPLSYGGPNHPLVLES